MLLATFIVQPNTFTSCSKLALNLKDFISFVFVYFVSQQEHLTSCIFISQASFFPEHKLLD